jgi:hypothetical protein
MTEPVRSTRRAWLESSDDTYRASKLTAVLG